MSTETCQARSRSSNLPPATLLRTSDAISTAGPGEQVLASIILFIVIYALIFLVWITVLNRKIKTGPEEEMSEVETKEHKRSWIDAATALAAHGAVSMTDAQAAPPETGKE